MQSLTSKKRIKMRQLISKFYKAKKYLENSRFMVTFFISGIMVFSALLYFEFNSSSYGIKNDIIGFVTYKTKSIKRKGESTVVWEDVNYKEPLAVRDTVRSDESSLGIFTLNDGTEIKLDENSMIVLDISDKTNSIGLLYGSIQANQNLSQNNSLEIKSGDLKIKLKGGIINLTKKENSDVEISVTKGEVVVEKKDKEYLLKEGYLFVSRKSEESRIVETYSILIAPENLKSILALGKESEVSLSWKAKENTSKLQFSTKEDFSTLIQEHIVVGEQFKVSLPKGIYYWRIIPVVPNNAFYIQTRKFTITEDIVFEYKYPQKDSVFFLQESPILVNFAWNKIETAKKYTLEVSKSSTFTEILKQPETDSNALSVDFMEEGIYFFRVRTTQKNSDHPEKISSVGSFSIKKQTELSRPSLISPPNGKKSESFDKVLFGWESNLSYSSYILTIADNIELTQNPRTKTTTNNFTSLDNLKANTQYFWRVDGLTVSGKSVSSYVQSFKTRADGEKEVVTNETPKLDKKEDNKTTSTPLDINKKEEAKRIESKKEDSGLSVPKSHKKSEIEYEEE